MPTHLRSPLVFFSLYVSLTPGSIPPTSPLSYRENAPQACGPHQSLRDQGQPGVTNKARSLPSTRTLALMWNNLLASATDPLSQFPVRPWSLSIASSTEPVAVGPAPTWPGILEPRASPALEPIAPCGSAIAPTRTCMDLLGIRIHVIAAGLHQ